MKLRLNYCMLCRVTRFFSDSSSMFDGFEKEIRTPVFSCYDQDKASSVFHSQDVGG